MIILLIIYLFKPFKLNFRQLYNWSNPRITSKNDVYLWNNECNFDWWIKIIQDY